MCEFRSLLLSLIGCRTDAHSASIWRRTEVRSLIGSKEVKLEDAFFGTQKMGLERKRCHFSVSLESSTGESGLSLLLPLLQHRRLSPFWDAKFPIRNMKFCCL